MRRSMENGASDIRRPQGVLKRKGLSKFYSSKSQSFSSMELALATGYGTSALALAKRPSCAELLCNDLVVPVGSSGTPKLSLRTGSMAAATSNTQGMNSSSPLSRSSVDNVFSPPHSSSHHMAFSCGGALQGSTTHQHQHNHYQLRSHHASLRHTSCQPAVDMDVLDSSHPPHLHHSPPSAAHLSLLLQARSCARSASSSGGGAGSGFLQQPRYSLTGAQCAGSPPCPTLCPTLGEDTEYVTLNLEEDEDDEPPTVPGTPLEELEEGVTLSGLSTGADNRSGAIPFPPHVLLPPPGMSAGSSTYYTGSIALHSAAFPGDPFLSRQGLSTSLPSPGCLTQTSSPQLVVPQQEEEQQNQQQQRAMGSTSLFGAPVCMQLSTEQLCAALNMSQQYHLQQQQPPTGIGRGPRQELPLPLSSNSFDAAAAAMAGLQLSGNPSTRLSHNDSSFSCGTPSPSHMPGDCPSGSLTSGHMAHQSSVSSGMDRSTGDSSNHSTCRASGYVVQHPRTPECTNGGGVCSPTARETFSRANISLTARDSWTNAVAATSFHSSCPPPLDARSMAYD